MAVKYGEIGRLGKLEAGFQQVPLVQTFWNFHFFFLIEHLIELIKKSKKKKKKKKKKNPFPRFPQPQPPPPPK